MNIRYPESMQIEVRIASSEPTQKYQFNDVLSQKISWT